MPGPLFSSELDLAGVAVALGADTVGELTAPEAALAASAPKADQATVSTVRDMIEARSDPLGDVFCGLRSPDARRPLGATYTPYEIVNAMMEWAEAQGAPDRVVDPGAGSARFTIAAGHTFPKARLIAVEVDPLAALCARANIAVSGLADRADVVLDDFRALPPQTDGRTLWLGNPPYVRHHQIAPDWKDWLGREASRRKLSASKLAGLHVHF
ncbi:MAG TPA: hypothetical protein VHA73_11640, partial [Acidimicrobiales bacterium]|nr:hypothetical protein [Acidimicrobiales bacterium]